jgi:hypothetical protein
MKKCIVVTPEQDQKIQTIVVRRISQEKKIVSYSSVMREIIAAGLEVVQ